MMKIAVAYPPFSEQGKRPLLGQNRQFRYSSSSEVRIYPMLPALAATWAAKNGHDVLWLDAQNDPELTDGEYEKRLDDFRPDLLLMEIKAPIANRYFRYVQELKEKRPETKVALCGDHASFFPREVMEKSGADFVLVGGDYDFLFSRLADSLAGRNGDLPGGIWYRKDDGEIHSTGEPALLEDLDRVPFIDRDLTRWEIYGEAYLRKPATYLLSGRGCKGTRGISVCTFCIWQHALWRRTARLRSPANVVAEIKALVEERGVREVFDDNESGPVWDQDWLREFHRLMKKEGLVGKVSISANARSDLLTKETCKLLKETGFRLLKVGIESGSPRILKEVIRKKETVEEIKQGIKNAKDQGLVVLMTNMVGYPEETMEEAEATYRMAKELMLYKTHAGDSLQASVLVAYPGTPLWWEAKKKGWFIVDPDDYESYRMDRVMMKTDIPALDLCNRLWRIHLHPKFILRSLVTARSLADLNVLWTGFKSLIGHLKDFRGRRNGKCD